MTTDELQHNSVPLKRPRFGLSRPVWMLGWVSFFTDTASEMIYPLLPLFLTQVLGAGAMSLGVVEGAAEAANSALKVGSGWLSDRTKSPKWLVFAGYGLSSAVRPLIALASAWPQILAIRFTDRIGKGIRGAPRDSMLASFAAAETRAGCSGSIARWITPGRFSVRFSRRSFCLLLPRRISHSLRIDDHPRHHCRFDHPAAPGRGHSRGSAD